MDPDVALRRIRELVKQLQPIRQDESAAGLEDAVDELIEHFEGLDDWLKKGGFLPSDWRRDG